MESLTRPELMRLTVLYSNYVMEYPDTHGPGCYPVCVQEFYMNEYQDLLAEAENKGCEGCGMLPDKPKACWVGCPGLEVSKSE